MTTTTIAWCRPIVIVVLVWSYGENNGNHCCRATEVFRPTRSVTSAVGNRSRIEGDAVGALVMPDGDRNLTVAEISLRRTTDALSKFLPFITTADTHTQCYKHTIMYLTDLNDFELWASKSESKPHYYYYYVTATASTARPSQKYNERSGARL